jgi:hypothetical protein
MNRVDQKLNLQPGRTIGISHKSGGAEMGYQLEGRLIEICDCDVVRQDGLDSKPDDQGCEAVFAYHIEQGSVDGVDVSGHTLAFISNIPGRLLDGAWTVVAIIDDDASAEQSDALFAAFSGRLGGPFVHFAQLIGDVIAVEQMPISFDLVNGAGTLKIGAVLDAEVEPYDASAGAMPAVIEHLSSTMPGSMTRLARAPRYNRRSEQYGLKDLSLKNQRTLQGVFRVES